MRAVLADPTGWVQEPVIMTGIPGVDCAHEAERPNPA